MTDQSEVMSKAEKKSEVLEIRLPHETKKAFMEACKDKNETASGVLRRSIDSFLSHGSIGPAKSGLRDTAFVLAGTLIGAIAYSVASTFILSPDATANPLAQLYFERVDENGDRRVSREEFVAAIVARGTTSRDNNEPDEVILRTTGVALIVQRTLSEQLRAEERLDGCFKTLAEMGDTERAREFYGLDSDGSNQLSFEEFAKSTRIPPLAVLDNAFVQKDLNGDGLLDRKETFEDMESWMEANASPNNAHTSSKYLGVPESCKSGDVGAGTGKLYIKFEQLKRRVDILTADVKPLADGMTDGRFANLDRNKDSRLSFAEFIRWYL